MHEQSEFAVSVLAIGEFEHDRAMLREIASAARWRLYEARDRRKAMQFLERNPVEVVLAESGLPNWNWKKILFDLRRLARQPQLIVASRTADDYLWSEVLNIGGHDVLPQPLRRDETERVVAAARRQFSRPAGRAGHIAAAPAVA